MDFRREATGVPRRNESKAVSANAWPACGLLGARGDCGRGRSAPASGLGKAAPIDGGVSLQLLHLHDPGRVGLLPALAVQAAANLVGGARLKFPSAEFALLLLRHAIALGAASLVLGPEVLKRCATGKDCTSPIWTTKSPRL